MGIGKAGGWFNELLGRAVYRVTIPGSEAIELRSRLEQAVRAAYEKDGFEVRVEEYAGFWFLRAHRGFTAGFGVGVLPQTGRPGEESVKVGVGRTSRLDEIAGSAVGFLAILSAVLSMLAVGVAGLQLPAMVLGVVALGTAVVTLVTVYQLVIPAVTTLEYFGGERLDGAQITAIVELVRGVVATCSNAPGLHVPSDPIDR